MAVKLDIKADIINTRFDKPKHSDVFFVDTNIWYWITYSNASHTAKYSQVNDYMTYLGKLRSVSSKLVRCNLTLAELAHIIEDTEFKIFCHMRGLNPEKYPKKEFRHNFQKEREKVVKEIESSWIQVEQFSIDSPILIDDAATTAFLTDIKTHKLDGYDLFYLDTIRKNGLQILTDDRDFATVPGITVFTANQSVIDEARTCGKLKIR
jgi:predicted nucleic acid-binding protein